MKSHKLIFTTHTAKYNSQREQSTYASLQYRKKIHRILSVFNLLADIPRIIQEKIDQTGKKHPAYLDDIKVVIKGSKQKHMDDLIDVPSKLEIAGYSLSESKSELFKTEIEWVGHRKDQSRIRLLQDKLLATKEFKKPEKQKELKSFLGAIQYLSKHFENFSAQIDILRQLLIKDSEWKWIEEQTKAFKNLKQKRYGVWHTMNRIIQIRDLLTPAQKVSGPHSGRNNQTVNSNRLDLLVVSFPIRKTNKPSKSWNY